jgi:hypothetical protein
MYCLSKTISSERISFESMLKFKCEGTPSLDMICILGSLTVHMAWS